MKKPPRIADVLAQPPVESPALVKALRGVTSSTILDDLDAAKPRRASFKLTGAALDDALAAKPSIASGRHTRTTLARVLKRRHSLSVSEYSVIRVLKEIGI